MNEHEKINYLEFPVRDIAEEKRFFAEAFGWTFIDYGEDYCAFSGAGIDGGFYRADLAASSGSGNGSMLVVFYSEGLSQTMDKVLAAGGTLVKPIFEFPGGRRFHFADPNGNEFAVWSDTLP
ncbi:VOC family protein [Aestuariirhabdus sp. Z084]|uniref:VOC family protein n=1 Tax=Aestuariirhabdus haliotis TaxID=2918751 RepID=UPI00201B4475|nr:VOC family protein [Aestuariirhabdus haliotis]MCL6416622.1 VOC family protein [Aestuariirhabdus haliotis]MCL6420657.1 VOC family protein [Aestuariirhabdus haliotis]